jgi:hypothetical protein
MKAWVYDPHSGGVKIPPAVKQRTEQRIRSYADVKYAGKYIRLGIRFHGVFCYIDAYIEPEEPPASLLLAINETREQYLERCRNAPVHLCRIRYFGDEERWSMAFYTYSNEKYEPSIFDNRSFHGTPEEAFETSAVYLQD